MDGTVYSEESFWHKLLDSVKAAGREVIGKALILYYCLLDSDTPTWAKGVIMGALAYFIDPIDAIPDWILAVGYVDDLGIIAAALGTVALHVKPDHREKAKAKLGEWFD